MPNDPARARPVEAFDFDGDYGVGYAELARRVIPAYEQTFQLAYVLLEPVAGPSGRILVTGCGTGVELITLGRLASGWQFVGVDPSREMLQQAKTAVDDEGFGSRVAFHEGFVSDLPDRGFDGATLFNVMHFLNDDGAKQRLLDDIAERLRPGGRLVMIDLHGEPGTPGFGETMARWERFMTVRGLTGEAQRVFRDRLDAGIRWVDAARINALLREAGFARVEQFFDVLFYGGWMADR